MPGLRVPTLGSAASRPVGVIAVACCLAAGCESIVGPEPVIHQADLTAGPAETIPWEALGTAGRLVFERASDTAAVYVLDAAERESWGLSGFLADAPAISPDGGTVAFTSLIYDPARPDGFWDLWKVDVRGGLATRLTSHAGLDRSPAWGADGLALFYYTVEVNQVIVRRLAMAGTGEDMVLGGFPGSAEGPPAVRSGDAPILAGYHCPPSVPCAGGLITIGPDGVPVMLTENPGTARIASPVWSPDGTLLAYLEVVFSEPEFSPVATRVVVVGPEGSRRVLAELQAAEEVTGQWAGSNVHSLAWSPDGTRIAFNHYDGPLQGSVWVVTLEGLALTRVTNGKGTDRSLSWSR